MAGGREPYRFDREPELLTALLRNARGSLGEIARDLDSYRQKVWRSVQALERDAVWGYTAILDERQVGWRRYLVLLKLAHAGRDFATRFERLREGLDDEDAVRVEDVQIISGVDYNFLIQLTCQNRLDVQTVIERFESALGAIMERPPRVIESIHALQRGGFANPDSVSLGSLVEEMGIVRARGVSPARP